MWRYTASLVLGLLLEFTAVAGLQAQTVRGTITSAADGSPIPGVFVLLVDDDGEEVDRTLSTARGTYRLRAPEPGSHLLRIERIGFESEETETFVVPDDGSVTRVLTVSPRPIQLAELEVVAEASKCQSPADEALELSRVWEEARKALAATSWTTRQPSYRFDTVILRQLLTKGGEPLSDPDVEEHRTYGRVPFRAVSADSLARVGWVVSRWGGLEYYGPDADVVLSDLFLESHCFRLVEETMDGERRLGLAFERKRKGRLADIEGVLWVDAESAELRSLDFRYDRLPMRIDYDGTGGEIRFDRLPDGSWMVHRWEIRTPLVETSEPVSWDRSPLRVTGVHHEVRQVVAVWSLGGSTGRPRLLRRYEAPTRAGGPGRR